MITRLFLRLASIWRRIRGREGIDSSSESIDATSPNREGERAREQPAASASDKSRTRNDGQQSTPSAAGAVHHRHGVSQEQGSEEPGVVGSPDNASSSDTERGRGASVPTDERVEQEAIRRRMIIRAAMQDRYRVIARESAKLSLIVSVLTLEVSPSEAARGAPCVEE